MSRTLALIQKHLFAALALLGAAAMLVQVPAAANGLSDLDKRMLAAAVDSSEAQPVREGRRLVYAFGVDPARLVCAPLRVCLIELEPGERIVQGGLHLGDTHRWGVELARGGDRLHLVVKPFAANLHSTATIITDRRTYYIDLVSDEEDYTPVIGWRYPGSTSVSFAGKAPGRLPGNGANLPGAHGSLASLDFGFTVSGCGGCNWRPSRVYTDGQQTVIQMPAAALQGELPALLAVGRDGKAGLVNYRVRGDRYVVDAVLSEAVLVAGAGKKRQRVVIRRATP